MSSDLLEPGFWPDRRGAITNPGLDRLDPLLGFQQDQAPSDLGFGHGPGNPVLDQWSQKTPNFAL